MINVSSRNKADIKESYDTLFELVNKNNIIEIGGAIDELEMNLKKYHISRGEEYNGFSDIFSSMKYARRHYNFHPEWRRQEMYRLLESLSKKIGRGYSELSLKEKLTEIYDDITTDVETYIHTGRPQDRHSLIDNFDALQKLQPEIKKVEYDIYEGYRLMRGNAGKCRASLLKLLPQEKEPGRWVINKDAVNSLTTSFEILYSSLDQVIASLDRPEQGKKDGEKKERVSDLEEDQEKALKSEARQLLKENWPLDEIARHLNMTVDEVVDLLDLDE